MPVAPVVTVVIVVTVTVAAAGYAFKEFIYEPHVAPRVETWRANFNYNREQRRRRKLAAHAIAVDTSSNNFMAARRSNLELDELTPRGVDSWRGDSNRNYTFRNRFGQNAQDPWSSASTALEAPNVSLPHAPLIPTHAGAELPTPTSTNTSRRVWSPEPAPTPTQYLSHRSSRVTLRSPSPPSYPPARSYPPAESYPPPQRHEEQHIAQALSSPPRSVRDGSSTLGTPSQQDRDTDFDVLSNSSGPGSPFSDFSFAAMQSPFVPMADPSARITSPFADPAREMDFVSVPSHHSDLEESGSDDFDITSPDVSAMSSSTHEDELSGSGVFSWASASAHSGDEM